MTHEEIAQKVEEVRSKIGELKKIAFAKYFEGHDPIFFLLDEFCQQAETHLNSYNIFIKIKK